MRLLTTVASILIGLHTPVGCKHPPGIPWTGRVAGYTVWRDADRDRSSIYLRYCGRTARGERPYVDVFAHEILHAKHPRWDHARIYRAQHGYGSVVLREIRRLS